MSNTVTTEIRGSATQMSIGKTKTTGKADRTVEKAIDLRTRMAIYKMMNNNLFQHINGCISTGKEYVIHTYTRSFYLHVSVFLMHVDNWFYLFIIIFLIVTLFLFSNRQMFIMLPIPMVKNMQLKYTKHLFWDLCKYTMTVLDCSNFSHYILSWTRTGYYYLLFYELTFMIWLIFRDRRNMWKEIAGLNVHTLVIIP